jgi:fructose/tagatose bisphosphate aldolase
MIVPTSNLFKLAYGKYAIGAYNINNLEQDLALVQRLHRSTPSLSLARAKHLGQRASYHSFARRSPENSLFCTVTG